MMDVKVGGMFPFPFQKASKQTPSKANQKSEINDIYKGLHLFSVHRTAVVDLDLAPPARHEQEKHSEKQRNQSRMQPPLQVQPQPRPRSKTQPTQKIKIAEKDPFYEETNKPVDKGPFMRECLTGKKPLDSGRQRSMPSDDNLITVEDGETGKKVTGRGQSASRPGQTAPSGWSSKDESSFDMPIAMRGTDPKSGSQPRLLKKTNSNDDFVTKSGVKYNYRRLKQGEAQKNKFTDEDLLHFMDNATIEIKDDFKSFVASSPDKLFEDFVKTDAKLSFKFMKEKAANPSLKAKDFVQGSKSNMNHMMDALQAEKSLVRKFVEGRYQLKREEAEVKEEKNEVQVFGQQNEKLKKDFKQKQKENPKLTYEQFVQEQVKQSSDTKKEFESFLLQKQTDKDFEAFVDANAELKKVYEKKKEQGEISNAREFIEANKTLTKKFEEFKEANIDELNLRKFVETNSEMKQLFEDFKVKEGRKDVTYEEFVDKNRKAKELYEREVVYNADSALNIEKFLLTNKEAREVLEAVADGRDTKTAIMQNAELRKEYQEFLKREQETAKAVKFLDANPELKRKFEREVKTNPETDVKEFLARQGKGEEFEKFAEKEDRRIELQQFVNSNEVLRDRFEQLRRQQSKADIEDFVEKNKEAKKEFEGYKKEKEEHRAAEEFLAAKPEVQKKFEEAKKKNQDLTAKDFLETTKDQKIVKEFEKFEEDTKVAKIAEERQRDEKKVAVEFGQQNEKLKKDFKQKQKENPKLTYEQFVQEQVKQSSDTKKEFESFLLQKQTDKDFEAFVDANAELKKVYEKKKEQGEISNAREFIEANKTLTKKFEEFKEANIDELNLRKFVETNSEMKQLFEDFKVKEGRKDVTYEEFVDKNRKAKELYEREVVYNADSALNIEKFLLTNKEAREVLEAVADGRDTKTAIMQNAELRKEYQEFLKREQETAKAVKFLDANPELKRKFEREVKTNPETDVKEFLARQGKGEEFEKFAEKEDRRIELQQFVNSNEVLRDRFEQLRRQQSKADIEDFVEKNKEAKKEFEGYKKEKEEHRAAEEFLAAKPEVQKKFEEAKKKNQDLTAKDFLETTKDQKIVKEFEKFEEDTKVAKIAEERQRDEKKVAVEFGQQNEKLKKDFKQKQKENPKLTYEQFVQEQVKQSSDTKKEFESFLLQKQTDKDFEAFVDANAELKKVYEKKKEQGEISNAREFIEANKTLTKKFEEFKEANIDELNLRKFVETNSEMKQLFEDFKVKEGRKDVTYEEFVDKNRKAKELYEREVVYNADSALNIEKFLLTNKEAREVLEAVADGRDTKTAIMQNAELRKEYQEFLKREQETAKAVKFLDANPELKRKFEREVKTNPETDVKEFLARQGKGEEFEKFAEKEDRRIELQQFVNSNEVLRDRFEQLRRQQSKADIEDFVEKNKEAKKEFEGYKKEKEEHRAAEEFLAAKPEVQKKFEEAKKKNQDLTAKDFLETTKDQKIVKEFEKFEEDTKVAKIAEERQRDEKKVAVEFGQQNEKLKKDFKQKQKENPKLTYEQFVQEQVKQSSDTKKEFESFLLQKQTDKDFEAFVDANAELKKVYEKKKEQGEISNAREFIEANKTLTKKFEEFKEANIDELNLRKFVETNSEMKQLFEDFKVKEGRKDVTYEEFVDKNRKAKELYEREVVYNADSALNIEKFLLTNKEAREVLEAVADGRDTKTAIMQNAELRKEYQEFLKREQETAKAVKFLDANPELKRKFEREVKTNPETDVKEFLARQGKGEEFEKFAEKEDRRIELQQFVNSNEVLRDRFEQLRRQQSKADIEDFVEKNKEAKKEFEGYKKEKEEHRAAEEFLAAKPEVQKKFEEAKKKNQDLTAKDFLETTKDQKIVKEFEKFEEDTKVAKIAEERQRDEKKVAVEFGQQNEKLKKDFKQKQKENPKLTYEQFVQEQVKQSSDTKKEFESFLLQKQTDKDFEAFVDANAELKKVYEKKKEQGEISNAREFIEANKTLTKKFEEFKEANIDELNLRKFVETNSEMKQLFEDFKVKEGRKDVTYEEFVDKNRKAKELYEREVVYNADSALNIEKFLLTNKEAREVLEAVADGRDTKTAIMQNAELRKEYQEFLKREQETAKAVKFLDANPELKRKFEREVKTNPETDVKEFLARQGKGEEFEKFAEKEDRRIELQQFVNSNEVLRDRFEQLRRQQSKADIEDFVEKNKEAKKEFEGYKKEKEEHRAAEEFLAAKPEVQKKFEEAKKKNQDLTAKDFLLASPIFSQQLSEFKDPQSPLQAELSDLRLHNAYSDEKLSDDLESYILSKPDIQTEFKRMQKAYPNSKQTFEQFIKELMNDPKIKQEYQEVQAKKRKVNIGTNLPGIEIIRGDIDDQEYVEEFILSNRELRDSFVEARKIDEKLTPEQFIKQAGATVARQLKKHEINLQRQANISNFMMSNDGFRKQFDESKKRHPTLTDEDFVRNNPEILSQYQDYVKRMDFDKIVDKYLKQNRDTEDNFLDYQEETGNNDFRAFIKLAPQSVQETFQHFLRHEEKVRELHKTLDENPQLKQMFLKAKSDNRNLHDIDLLAKDDELRHEVEKAQVHKLREEANFTNFVKDNPEIKAQFDNFKLISINAGAKEFLDYHSEALAEFKIYTKNEERQKAKFEMLIGKDQATGKAFDEFVNTAKANPKVLSKIIEDNPKLRSNLDDFLKNDEKSKLNYERFVKSNSALLRQFESEKIKNKRLTFKQFVESNKNTKAEHTAYISSALSSDVAHVDAFLKQNPNIKKDLAAVLTKDPTLLFKEFLQSNESAQQKLKEVQRDDKTPKHKTMMSEFLRKNPDAKKRFDTFVEGKEAQGNKNIFRSFINNDIVRKQKFIEFVKTDPASKKAFEDYKKKNPAVSFEEFVRTNLFENASINKRFVASKKDIQRDFEQFVKEDDCVIREFINADKDAKVKLNRYLRSNQRAMLNYEMFIKQNPQALLTFEEYLTENPEVLIEDHTDHIYNAFLSENPELMRSYLDNLQKNPDMQITAKDFIEGEDSVQKLFTEFATDSVIKELENIEEFSSSLKEIADLIPAFIENNESQVLNIISRDPALRKLIEEARKKNPTHSLAKLVNLNPQLKKQCFEVIRDDKCAVRNIIKGNKDLRERFIKFVEDKQLQEADFEDFVKNNEHVKSIFENMKRGNPSLTIETLIKEAKKNEDIKDLYIKETLYNPDSKMSYHQYLMSNTEVRKAYETAKQEGKAQVNSLDEFVTKIKNDTTFIDRYRAEVSSDPTLKNFIREFIDENNEVKNKFHQFVKERVDKDENFVKFVESNKVIKQSYDDFIKQNPGSKISMKDFVNKNAMVKAKYITFVKDHPETLEEFVESEGINYQYRDFHVKAQGIAHFDHFLKNSTEVKKEYELACVKRPQLKMDEFIREFRGKDVARKMFEKHQKVNTKDALRAAIRNKEQRLSVQGGSPGLLRKKFEFKESLQELSKSHINLDDIDKKKGAYHIGKAGNDDDRVINKQIKSLDNGKNVPEHDQDSIGSNALMSPQTGLKNDEIFSSLDGKSKLYQTAGVMGFKSSQDFDAKVKPNISERSNVYLTLDIATYDANSDNEGNRLDFNHSDTKGRYKGDRDKLSQQGNGQDSPTSSFVSGNAKLVGFEDRKEDEWEKLSRISRRTAQNKKPVNLDSIEDKIKTLHSLHIDIGRDKSRGSYQPNLRTGQDEDPQHLPGPAGSTFREESGRNRQCICFGATSQACFNIHGHPKSTHSKQG